MSEDQLSQLERLARLRDQGALSEAEFEQQKGRLLGSSTPTFASDGPATQELIFHLSAEARVTNHRAIFGTATYPIGDISAASMAERPAKPLLGYALIAGALLVAAGTAFIGMRGDTALSDALPGAIVALVLGVIGVALAATAKPRYSIRLWTTSGEVEALSSPDRRHVDEVLGALNKALSRRGTR